MIARIIIIIVIGLGLYDCIDACNDRDWILKIR